MTGSDLILKAAGRLVLRSGDEVLVFSQSCKQWLPATVVQGSVEGDDEKVILGYGTPASPADRKLRKALPVDSEDLELSEMLRAKRLVVADPPQHRRSEERDPSGCFRGSSRQVRSPSPSSEDLDVLAARRATSPVGGMRSLVEDRGEDPPAFAASQFQIPDESAAWSIQSLAMRGGASKPMQIFVDKRGFPGHLNQESSIMQLDVDATDTVLLVKGKIHAADNIALDEMVLLFGRLQLDDRRELALYDVGTNSTLCLMPAGKVFKLDVETHFGNRLRFNVRPTYKISQIKAKLSDYEGIHPDEQMLGTHSSFTTPLKDSRTLADYEIVFHPQAVGANTRGQRAATNELCMQPYPVDAEWVTVEIAHTWGVYRKYQGKRIKIYVGLGEPILNIKARLFEKECIFPDRQQLSWRTFSLDEDRNLRHYNIESSTLIQLRILDPTTR